MKTKKFCLYDIFLESNQILRLNILKLLKIPVFFSLNCQIAGFSRFSGKVATLSFLKLIIDHSCECP